MRGLSTAIAGLIVFTFLLVVLVPLIISLYRGSIQAHILLNSEVSRKLRTASPELNITYDVSASTPSTRYYDVVNNGGSDVGLELYLVTDGSRVYVVKAAATYGSLFPVAPSVAGTLSVETEATSSTVLVPNSSIVLKAPLGRTRIIVVNGKLLGVITSDGSYVKASTTGTIHVTQYAAVAGSLQSYYFNLTSFYNIPSLFNDPNIIIASSPNASASDPSLLSSDAMQANCFYGRYNETGAFVPDSSLGSSSLYAFMVMNLGPEPGSMIVGGLRGPYNSTGYGSALWIDTYSLAAYEPGLPGVSFFYFNDGSKAICFDIYYDGDYYARCMSWGGGSGSVFASNYASYFLYDTWLSSSFGSIDVPGGSVKLVLWDGVMGFIAWSNDRYGVDLVIYCPSGSYTIDVEKTTIVVTKPSECSVFTVDGRAYWGTPSSSFTISNLNILSYYNDSNLHLYLEGSLSGFSINIDYRYSYGSEYYINKFPIIMKLSTNYTGLLQVYDGFHGSLYNGSKAFGTYYYSGNAWNEEGVMQYVYYDVHHWWGYNATLKLYYFAPGVTGGIEPYLFIADTDGNNLNELIFIDEGFGFGYSDTYDDLSGRLTYIYNPNIGISFDYYVSYNPVGCLERTLKTIYVKFVNKYAINGSQIAEVAVQIRYLFHDNAGDDVDDVDYPKNGIFGFYLVGSDGQTYSSTEFIYQQLMNQEDTWPPNTNFITTSVYLPIPDKNQLFYVVYGLGDPYGWPGTHDDLDYTVDVEWIGMWFLHR